MADAHHYRTIAHIRSEFPSKFGVPRQSGLVPELSARVVFEPEFRNVDAVRGLEGFSHIWLIWEFSLSTRSGHTDGPSRHWTPTVRPPRLRGRRVGVFATRSPFRPNPIGLSSVELAGIDVDSPDAPVLFVKGADLVDGTPILDIKPYIPFDVRQPIRSGFIDDSPEPDIEVSIPTEELTKVPEQLRPALWGVLGRDPRPVHMDDPDRVFALPFAGLDVRFRFDGLHADVLSINSMDDGPDASFPGYREGGRA